MTDYDSPWKEARVYLFGEFLGFYFPAAADDVDWARGHETLDKELQQVLREAEAGKRVVDHLVKVWLKNGQEEWLLIHVEIQAQADPDFLARLYSCNTRIFDKYQRDVVTFVILADESETWRPAVYEFNRWGFHLRMQFPTVKLLDIVRTRDDLETSPNPFAVLTLAHVRTQETRNDLGRRRIWKFRLVRSLYQRGMSADAVRCLFRCVDWMMNLSKEMEDSFWDDVIQLTKENKMPFIDIATRKGMEIGRQEGKEEGRQEGKEEAFLEAILFDWESRFGFVDEHAKQEIEAIHDLNLLRQILCAGKTAASLDELRKLWKPARSTT